MLTIEEAIAILDLSRAWDPIPPVEAVVEAYRMAADALREKLWVPLSRETPQELDVVQLTDGVLVCPAYRSADGVWRLQGLDVPVEDVYPFDTPTHWKPLSDPPEV